jgi:hypothetical protein
MDFSSSSSRNNGLSNATLYDKNKNDIGKGLVQDGFIIAEKRPGRRFAKIVSKLTIARHVHDTLIAHCVQWLPHNERKPCERSLVQSQIFQEK